MSSFYPCPPGVAVGTTVAPIHANDLVNVPDTVCAGLICISVPEARTIRDYGRNPINVGLGGNGIVHGDPWVDRYSGYPDFTKWPSWETVTAQQMYYEWLERAHRAGLNLIVVHAVNNELLCRLANHRASYGCDDMSAVRRQIVAAKELETYIDLKHGGRGAGWYRIVTSGQQARDVIADGKLAVVLGIEVADLFECKLTGCPTQPGQDARQYVDAQLQQYYDLGVRHVFPVHDFDNAFGGTAIWRHELAIANNFLAGEPPVVEQCSPAENEQNTIHYDLTSDLPSFGSPYLVALEEVIRKLAGAADLNAGNAPHCNARGLSQLGEHLVRRMMDLHMIIDIDHMSSKATNEVLELAEARGYPGLVSSHGGLLATDTRAKSSEIHKSDSQIRRLTKLGGVLGLFIRPGTRTEIKEYRHDGAAPLPFSCGSSDEAWAQVHMYAVDALGLKAVGIGSDFNGMVASVAPRFPTHPGLGHGCGGEAPPTGYHDQTPRVDYSTEFPALWAGRRAFDYNYQGLANIGLYPDFLQDIKNLYSDSEERRYLRPLFCSAEAYVHMWQRTDGSATREQLRCEGTPPVIRCAAPDDAWHPGNVAIACTALDEQSGLMNAEDASFSLSTDVPPGVETVNAVTAVRKVCDQEGNCSQAGPIGGIRVDRRPPDLTVREPVAKQYLHTAQVTLDYDAVDAGAGVRSVSARLDGASFLSARALESGRAIDLLTEIELGQHDFIVDADDRVGNRAATQSVQFSVIATVDSLFEAVDIFRGGGAFKNKGQANAVKAKLQTAADAQEADDCTTANERYRRLIEHLRDRAGKGIAPAAAAILIAAVDYLIAHCPVDSTTGSRGGPTTGTTVWGSVGPILVRSSGKS
jgi:microsomal dipeptidase-like Zn-dependent dipeptidase